MKDVLQKSIGIGNSQIVNVFECEKTIDILPDELELFLDYLSNNASLESGAEFSLSVPDLLKKNEKNGINEDYFSLIENDFSSFQDIDEILRKNDKSGTLKEKYKNAARLLNLQYVAKFHSKMMDFILKVSGKYQNEKNAGTDEVIKMTKLLHYMYAQCDIGVKP